MKSMFSKWLLTSAILILTLYGCAPMPTDANGNPINYDDSVVNTISVYPGESPCSEMGGWGEPLLLHGDGVFSIKIENRETGAFSYWYSGNISSAVSVAGGGDSLLVASLKSGNEKHYRICESTHGYQLWYKEVRKEPKKD